MAWTTVVIGEGSGEQGPSHREGKGQGLESWGKGLEVFGRMSKLPKRIRGFEKVKQQSRVMKRIFERERERILENEGKKLEHDQNISN